MSTRIEQKAARRAQLLAAAKPLFADRGVRGVRLEDIGRGAGVSGPAVYRHFASKEAVLAELLLSISERLRAGGEEIVAAAASPQAAVEDLIDFHVDFALSEPELIRIQDRDLDALSDDERHSVRRLQRTYASTWATALRALRPDWDEEAATVRVHALFGMLNATPHLARRQSAEAVASGLRASARAAVGVA